jgi:hypothetical protein
MPASARCSVDKAQRIDESLVLKIPNPVSCVAEHLSFHTSTSNFLLRPEGTNSRRPSVLEPPTPYTAVFVQHSRGNRDEFVIVIPIR